MKIAAAQLEQLLPEVIPAVSGVVSHRGNVAAIRQLKMLVQEWGKETATLVTALDSMTDPVFFLQISGISLYYLLTCHIIIEDIQFLNVI